MQYNKLCPDMICQKFVQLQTKQFTLEAHICNSFYRVATVFCLVFDFQPSENETSHLEEPAQNCHHEQLIHVTQLPSSTQHHPPETHTQA